MVICNCSLAGTVACKSCANNVSCEAQMAGFAQYIEEQKERVRMIDLASVGLERKQQYSDSTLMNMKKSELVKYIRLLEHNYDVQVSFNIQQCRNFEEMLKGERKLRGEE